MLGNRKIAEHFYFMNLPTYWGYAISKQFILNILHLLI